MRHHKAIFPITFSLSLLFPNSSVLALSTRTVFASQAQGINGSTVTLEVSPGHGLNINFIPTGETIKKAWIDDPSQIALSFDGNLCQSSGDRQQECTDVGASVIHLRQIKPINFPNLPRSPNGSTLLTVITEGSQGRKLYQFQIDPASGKPQYTALNIRPDSEEPTPVANQVLINTSDSERTVSRESGTFKYPTTSRDSLQGNESEPQPSSTNIGSAVNETQPSNTSSVQGGAAPLPKEYTEQPSNTAVHHPLDEVGGFSEQPTNLDFLQGSVTAQSTTDIDLTLNEPAVATPLNEAKSEDNQSTSFYSLQGDESEGESNQPTSRDSLQDNESEPSPSKDTDPAINEPAIAKPSLSESTHYSQQIINEVSAAPSLVLGLLVARQRGAISPNTPEWLEAQTAHSWLRRGKTIEEAAIRAEMSPFTLKQLIQWGQGI